MKGLFLKRTSVINCLALLLAASAFSPSQHTYRRPHTIVASKPSQNINEEEESLDKDGLVRTLPGGSSLLFDMARRMSLGASSDTVTTTTTNNNAGISSSSTSSSMQQQQQPQLPRWHPVQGISSVNPNFRTQPPKMDTQGYAVVIWRHARKKSPAMWRYALRCYDRMEHPPETIHAEGALQACAKLGDWKKALQIYESVRQRVERYQSNHVSAAAATTTATTTADSPPSLPKQPKQPSKHGRIHVTETMVVSVVRACVRAARRRPKTRNALAQRQPLDAAVDVVVGAGTNAQQQQQPINNSNNDGIPLVARHLNPIAAAYQYLGLHQAAADLIKTHLTDRTSGPEDEDGPTPLNIYDVGAKDKASYSLLVQGAVSTGNWTGAVDALMDMTEAGLFPASRHLNAWTEVSERKTKQRTTRSWKKKREEYWLDSVRTTATTTTVKQQQ